ncbi:MAG: hypothetical protein F6K24_33920, partial [Okeania sp. SIO2D1]|nr:hypothetical protein [Okeania sp. SIO2D1]
MKCVKCETDNNLKERTKAGGRCKNCNHPFAFDPKAGSKFTDIFFNNSIQTISSENTLFFTPKQLWYLIEKRLARNTLGLFIYYVVLLSFIGLISLIILRAISASAIKINPLLWLVILICANILAGIWKRY